MKRQKFSSSSCVSRLLILLLIIFIVGCAEKTSKIEQIPLTAKVSPYGDLTKNLPAGYKKTAPLFENMGTFHHPVNTKVPLAQKYFDQGMVLAFGFNHAEAARSFREAQKLDPNLAMAYWGEALVLGPNINAQMEAEKVEPAWNALQKAKALASRAFPENQSYIQALQARYKKNPPKDRSSLDTAYADALGKLVKIYPEDYDLQALYAEALMTTMPWDYWDESNQPREKTEIVLQTLERVLARDPNHLLANHLYIHTVEKTHPQWAAASADRLGSLAPDAGHLVHMPAHIFIRVGRYREANEANESAAAADQSYITQCHAQGLYPLAYVPHNHHFLWFGKAMVGQRKETLDAAVHVRSQVDKKKMREAGFGTLQHFYTLPLWTYVRFGMWKEALLEEKPAEDLLYPNGVWHFARGMAYARKGQEEEAQKELAQLAKLAANRSLEKVTIWDLNTTRSLLLIAEKVLQAAIAEQKSDFTQAISLLNGAVKLEDALNYDEPPVWFIPTRQLLGAVLLAGGKPSEAEEVYRADLAKYPANGWSLKGLSLALDAQQDKEAQSVKSEYQKVWAQADVTLNNSRF